MGRGTALLPRKRPAVYPSAGRRPGAEVGTLSTRLQLLLRRCRAHPADVQPCEVVVRFCRGPTVAAEVRAKGSGYTGFAEGAAALPSWPNRPPRPLALQKAERPDLSRSPGATFRGAAPNSPLRGDLGARCKTGLGSGAVFYSLPNLHHPLSDVKREDADEAFSHDLPPKAHYLTSGPPIVEI